MTKQILHRNLREYYLAKFPRHQNQLADFKDQQYELDKKLVDTLQMPMKSRIDKVIHTPKTYLFFTHRKGLVQHKSYLSAVEWIRCTSGPCSFFIRGYHWPWHTKQNYVGNLQPTGSKYKSSI